MEKVSQLEISWYAADQFSEVGDKVLDIGSKALETSQDLENASKKVN